jgi:DNA-directed RNA polymerase specialized sigma24 family protein
MGRLRDDATSERAAEAYLRLRNDLARWLQKHCEKGLDRENIASDAMQLAITEFDACPLTEPRRVWAWMRGTAMHRVNELRRAARAHRIDLRIDLEVVAAAKPEEMSASRASELVSALRSAARGVPLQVLQMLEHGASNAEIAGHLGICLRAVERARQRLRELLLVLAKA